jgi:hypothetical protein
MFNTLSTPLQTKSGPFMLQTRKGYCLFRIPDPSFFHPGSRIRLKELKYFNPNKWFLSTQKYDLFYPSRILDPGSRGQKVTGSRIRIRNTVIVQIFKFLLVTQSL